jgi:hypothetical protein
MDMPLAISKQSVIQLMINNILQSIQIYTRIEKAHRCPLRFTRILK